MFAFSGNFSLKTMNAGLLIHHHVVVVLFMYFICHEIYSVIAGHRQMCGISL